MPHYFQFYTDFILNEERLTISRAVKSLNIPHLIIHGDKDTSVTIKEANLLHQWSVNSNLVVIKGANHVFGVWHPWEEKEVSNHLQQVINSTIVFLKS